MKIRKEKEMIKAQDAINVRSIQFLVLGECIHIWLSSHHSWTHHPKTGYDVYNVICHTDTVCDCESRCPRAKGPVLWTGFVLLYVY